MRQIVLTRKFPISRRLILMRAFPTLLISALVVAGMYLIQEWRLIPVVVAIIVAQVLYLMAYRKRFRVEVFRRSLIVTRGVVLVRQGSFPLDQITELYLGQDGKHLLLGLFFLEVRLPGQLERRFSRIEGLSRRNALALRQSIHRLISDRRDTGKRGTIAAADEAESVPPPLPAGEIPWEPDWRMN
jgi:hypothetical protein